MKITSVARSICLMIFAFFGGNLNQPRTRANGGWLVWFVVPVLFLRVEHRLESYSVLPVSYHRIGVLDSKRGPWWEEAERLSCKEG